MSFIKAVAADWEPVASPDCTALSRLPRSVRNVDCVPVEDVAAVPDAEASVLEEDELEEDELEDDELEDDEVLLAS